MDGAGCYSIALCLQKGLTLPEYVYAHNRDDHSKNFSFLMNTKGEWQFAPAYDLTFSHSGFGFHSTMIAGESKNPGRKELMRLAAHFGLKNAGSIIEED